MQRNGQVERPRRRRAAGPVRVSHCGIPWMSCVLGSVCDWEVVHQRLSLDIDVARQRIVGIAVLAVIPHNTDPGAPRKNQPSVAPQHKRLYLNCGPDIQIQSVTVDEHSATFELRSVSGSERDTAGDPKRFPETNFLVAPPDLSTLRSLDAYGVVFDAHLDWLDQGELCIFIPDQVVVGQKQLGPLLPESVSSSDAAAMDGLNFTRPSTHFPRTPWTAFAYTEFANASAWFPCRLSHWERATFDFHITVPSSYKVFCPGRLVRETPANETHTKTEHCFEVDEPILARSVSFAVGEFEVVSDDAYAGLGFPLTHCMPAGFAPQDHLLHTVSCTSEIFSTYAEYLGQSYPLPGYTQVFVDPAFSDVQSMTNVTLLSADLIHSDAVIDQTWKARRSIAEGIARSWISHTVQPRTHADHWIVEGMVGFLVAIYIEKAFGRNERRIQRQRITDDVVRGARLPWTIPISSELYGHPAEVHSLYFHQKSTIVMHMLADLIGESSFRDIVKQLIDDDAVLPQADLPMLQPDQTSVATPSTPMFSSGTPLAAQLEKPSTGGSARGISTKRLLKLARHRSALNLDDFCERWINGVHCPVLKVAASFERKKSACRVQIEQAGVIAHGILKVYVYETDQQVYEHESRMDSLVETFVFSCHSKVRKNRKRFDIDAGEEDEDEFSGGDDEVLEGDEGSPTDGADGSLLSKHGKKLKNDTPIRWVRIDPKFGWIRSLSIDQLPLWAELELRHSPDVIAQIEAVICLGKALLRGVISAQRGKEKDPLQTLMAFNALKDCLENGDYFHQVRVFAAQQFATCARPRKVNGTDRQLSVLIDFIKEKLYSPPDYSLVEPTGFNDFSEHLVIRGTFHAVASVRIPGPGGRPVSPNACVDLLVDLLKDNDNSQNYYDDSYYVSDLLTALGKLAPATDADRDRVFKQIERLLDHEHLFPSYRRLVTCACLSAVASIQVAHARRNEPQVDPDAAKLGIELVPSVQAPVASVAQRQSSPDLVFDVLRYASGHHPPAVRVTAVASGARIAVARPDLVTRLVECISRTRSPVLRIRMAEAWSCAWTDARVRAGSADHNPFSAFEDVSTRQYADAIWSVLTGPQALSCERFRQHIYVVYACAFGMSAPKCMSDNVDLLARDREILSDKRLARCPNAVRRSAARAKQKQDQQFTVKQKKRPARPKTGAGATDQAKQNTPAAVSASPAIGAPRSAIATPLRDPVGADMEIEL
ncbi:Transcription initiation factor TFIID subunit 2 [Plasmodiophora brassicae]